MMRCATLVLAGLMAARMASGANVLQANFDVATVGDYSFDACKAAFPGVTWNNGLSPDSRVKVVEGGDTAWSGRALRVFYPATCLGPTGTGGALACGAQWRSNFGGTHDTLMLRYRVFFPKGFEWVKGGKLPGLCGSQCNTGGNVPTGTDGWSTRIMWRANGQLTLYVYYPGQSGTYGTDLLFKDSTGKTLTVSTGVWHELVTKVSLNTPSATGAGNSDGRVQAWFDGKIAVDSGSFRLRDRDTMHVNQFYFSTFYGGSTTDFSPPSDNRIFFDDFQIADTLVPGPATSIQRPGTFSSPSGLRFSGRSLQWDGREPAKLTLRRPDGSIQSVHDLHSRPERLDLRGSGVVVWNLDGISVKTSGLAYLP